MIWEEPAAALTVHPVQIGPGVGNSGTDLKKICSCCFGKTLYGPFGDVAGRKIGDQFFAHNRFQLVKKASQSLLP